MVMPMGEESGMDYWPVWPVNSGLELDGCRVCASYAAAAPPRRWRHHHLAHIGNLLQLKYLSLKDTSINVLPQQITRLQYLQTLNVDVRGTINLPTHIFRLGRLIHLLVEMRSKLPDEIGNMQALQELKVLNVFVQSLSSLHELAKLTNLRKLSIYMYGDYDNVAERYKDHINETISMICRLVRYNLHCLTIRAAFDSADDFIQEPWCPPPFKCSRTGHQAVSIVKGSKMDWLTDKPPKIRFI
uniref:Disease resistance R13L4/SHOC-2-like LRR domain-containing protein n=1 Tax=Leersia perrieri TaxID=77586 RepID=A0A0D9X795_9ORYZ